MVLGSLTTATTLFLRDTLQAHAASTLPGSYFAPYAEIGTGASLQSVTQSTGQKYYTLAFITGNGCSPVWDGSVPVNNTGSSLPTLTSDISYIRSQGGDVIISFGGAAGQELAQTCGDASSLQAQYQAVINQYNASHLDFDIEGGEEGDSTTYTRRNTALAALQRANPGLTISFTLPSATTGLESSSLGLLKNAVSQGVNFNIVNLMTMDYGSADSQMGQESINAANGLYAQLQNMFPGKTASQLWSMVGITTLIGQNDTPGEIFTLSNGSQVLSFAQANKIGELSFWAVSRDNGSCPGNTSDLDTCDGLSQSTYAFTNLFKPFSSGSTSNPTPTPTSSGGIGSGYYYVANRYSGLVLDDTNWSTSNGTLIQQWSEVSGQTNQQWRFVPTGDGYYYIQNNYSGLVLDDTNWSTSNGNQIQQWSKVSGQSDQEWSPVATGDGYYYLKNRYSGLVLDDTGWSTSNGTIIQQWSEVSGQTNQEWSLLPV
jgi:chitinase